MIPSKTRKKKRLRPWDGVLIIVLTYLLVNGLAHGGIVPVQWLAERLPQGATTINVLFVQQSLQWVIMVGLTLFFLAARGCSVRRIGLRAPAKKRWLLYGVVLGIVICFVMLQFMALWALLFPQLAQPQEVGEMLGQAVTPWEYLVVLLMVSVYAPISEELLFRGYVFHSMPERFGLRTQMLLTALLFGAMHYDLFRLVPLTMAGYFLNVVAVKSGSLWTSILVHGVWNCMMSLLLFYFGV